MKKLYIALIITCTGVLNAYTPTQGPLTFIDTQTKFGAIRSTVAGNPQLGQEANIIGQFAATLPPASQTYQGMVDEIIQSQSPLAIQTLQAFENVIMYMYHDKAYLVKIPFGTDFTYQGIRNSWLNPLSYITPKNWIGDNNTELDQLLEELSQLAKIAQAKKPLMGARMHAKVNLYRHWRKYTLVGIASYLTYDRATRKWEDTFLYHLYHDYNFKKIAEITKDDAIDGYNFAGKQGKKVYNVGKDFWNREEIHKKQVKEKQRQDAIKRNQEYNGNLWNMTDNLEENN